MRGRIWLDGVGRDLAHGARLLRRHPGFATVAVGTVALAIGAAVAVFSVVDAWLIRPLNFPAAERLVIAFAARPERPTEPAVWLPYRAYLAWKDRSRALAAVAAAFPREVTLIEHDSSRSVLGLAVSPEFFATLGIGALRGRTIGAAGETDTAVLSHGLWQRQFGGADDLIGRSIILSGRPYRVVGVMPRDFETRILDMRFELWTPIETGVAGYTPDGVGPVALIGRLRPGITADAATLELASLTRDTESAYAANFNQFVVSLASLQADNTRTVRATLTTVAGAVLALLLLAAMNVSALLLGRGFGRIREAAIRIAIGCDRSRLLRQFLTESAVISVIAAALGLGLAAAAMPLFTVWNPLGALPANDIRVDWRVVAATIVAMTITTVVCGLVPALRVSSADPQEALGSAGARGSINAPAERAQGFILVVQMAGSVVLLVAATLLIRSFVRLQTEPLGFDPDNLWVADVVLPDAQFDSSEKRNAFYQQFADRVGGAGGVRSVAGGTSLLLASGAPVTVNLGVENSPDARRISGQEVTPTFFETLGIPLLHGRAFDSRDSLTGRPVVILNARASRDLFGDPASAVGRGLRLNDESFREVIGVVGDVRSTFFNTLAWRTDPIIYRPAAQAFRTRTNPMASTFGFKLHIRSDRAPSLDEIRQAAMSISPLAAVTELQPAVGVIADATRQPAFRMALLLWFSLASLLLAAIGTYGLVSQAIAHSIRELAIRLALGARPGGLVGLVVTRALGLAAAGLIIGMVAALALGQVLESLLYGVRPRDTLSFIGVAAMLLVVTAVAALLPALRARRLDPAQVLRTE